MVASRGPGASTAVPLTVELVLTEVMGLGSATDGGGEVLPLGEENCYSGVVLLLVEKKCYNSTGCGI